MSLAENNALCDVSIIIVSYNTRALLEDCVRSIIAQTLRVSYQIIVVDNNSRDGSATMLEAEFPFVRLIRNTTNRGFAAANNQAFSHAQGRYILMLNPDTLILDRAIEQAVSFADKDPNIGALGCRIRWPDRSHQHSVFRFLELLDVAIYETRIPFLFPNHPFWNHARYGGSDFSKSFDVDVVAGCFLLVRTHVIAEVGPLDEDFFMYGEEMEWCFRIKQAGHRIVYYPIAEIMHLKGQGGLQFAGGLKVAGRRAGLLFLDKAKGLRSAWCANFVMSVGLIPRIPVWFAREILNVMIGRCDRNRLRALGKTIGMHLAGLFWPVWRRSFRV